MKKTIIGGALFTFIMLAAPLIGNSSCEVTRNCAGAGTISCSGIDGSCSMAPPGVANPWVKCNGSYNYCFGSPV